MLRLMHPVERSSAAATQRQCVCAAVTEAPVQLLQSDRLSDRFAHPHVKSKCATLLSLHVCQEPSSLVCSFPKQL